MDRASLDSPPVRAAAGTALGYGVVLFVLFVCLFVLPFVLFSLL